MGAPAMPVRRRAGQRRHMVALQSITSRTASGDGYVPTWTTYATVWASVLPATPSNTQRLIANTQQTPTTHVVELDYQSSLRASHRVLVGGTLTEDDASAKKLYISGLQDDEERHITHILSCEERPQ